MSLLPVADLIIIERKTCSRCGSVHESPSPFRYRMFKSPSNEPDKTELRKLKWEPSKREEALDLIPLDRRCTAYFSITMDQCHLCWGTTIEYEAAKAIRPLPSITSMTGLSLALIDAASRNSAPKPRPGPAKPKRPPMTIDQLAADLGL